MVSSQGKGGRSLVLKDLLLRCVPALQDLPPDQMKPGTLLLRILRMKGQKGRRAQKGCRITSYNNSSIFMEKTPPPPPQQQQGQQQHHQQEEEQKHKQLPTVTPSVQPHYP